MAVRFINCDLEVEGPRSLEYLLADLSGSVECLGYRKTERGCFAGFELPIYQSYEPNSIIVGFCDVIERLRDNARATWRDAFYRKFDLGYECDSNLGFFRSEIRADTVRRAAALGASIVVTIYTRHFADPDAVCLAHEEATDGGAVR